MPTNKHHPAEPPPRIIRVRATHSGLGFHLTLLILSSIMSRPSIDYYNDALDALQAGNASEAVAAVENSLTEDPEDTQTWQLYVVILNSLGRTDDAEKAAAKLKKLGLSEADELLLLAAKNASAGNVAAALPHYEAAIALEPHRAEIQTAYALALLHCDDREGGLAAAERAVTLAPDDPQAHYALGRIHRLSGHLEAALTAFTRSLELDPGGTLALYEQGMVLAETGRGREALANFEKFLDAHPGDPAASQAIATIHARMESGS